MISNNSGERFANEVKERQKKEELRLHAASRAGKVVPLENETASTQKRIRKQAAANLADEERVRWQRLISASDAA